MLGKLAVAICAGMVIGLTFRFFGFTGMLIAAIVIGAVLGVFGKKKQK